MRLIAHIGVAYLVMVLAGPLWPVLPFQVLAPNLAVVFAAYLGITTRGRIADPTAAAIVVGYLSDLLCGAPRGLMGTVCGAVCMLARFATARLLVRGFAFIAGFCAAASLFGWIVVVAVRVALADTYRAAYFSEGVVAVGSALLTGILAPPLFRLCRLVDARFARTEREREAVREGYLN